MSAKNNSESEYYGGDLVTWCNVTNMSAKNNSESESSRSSEFNFTQGDLFK